MNAIFVFAATLGTGQPESRLEAERWGGKPVWVASTVAKLHDISPDGKRFLFGDGRKLGCFDRGTSKLEWLIDNPHLHSAKFSPDGKTIVTAEWEAGLNLYDATTGKSLFKYIPDGPMRVGQAGFLPDGTVVYLKSRWYYEELSREPWKVAQTMDYTLVHWDTARREPLRRTDDTLKYGNTNIWLSLSGAGLHMERKEAFGNDRPTHKTVSYTNPVTGKTTPTITLDANDDHLFDLNPDGTRLLVMTVGKPPRVVDTATGKTTHTLEGNKRLATAGAFSPDGKLIAIVTGTELSGFDLAKLNGKVPEGPAELMVWDAATGKQLARSEFPTSQLDFVQVRFSADARFLVAVSKEGLGGNQRRVVAFGRVPFDAKEGGAGIVFPRDEEVKAKPAAVIAPKPGLIADPLEKLVSDLARVNKPFEQKVDAVFLAALGRFATEDEQKRVKAKYGEKSTLETLTALVAEIAATPEFDAHVKTLQKRLPATKLEPGGLLPYPGFPTTPSTVLPFPFGPGGPSKPPGTFVPPGSGPLPGKP